MTRTTTQLFGIALVVAIGVLALTTMVFAQEAEETVDAFKERREEVREALDAQRAAVEQQRLEARATATERIASSSQPIVEQLQARRAALAERLTLRIQNLLDNMARRMDAAIERLKDIADRMESRIEKLEATGVDGSEAYGFINTARTELNLAAELIDEEFEDVAEDAVTSENPREHMQGVRTTFIEAGSHIRAAHEALRSALSALKDAVAEGEGAGVSDAVQNDASATTTEDNEN